MAELNAIERNRRNLGQLGAIRVAILPVRRRCLSRSKPLRCLYAGIARRIRTASAPPYGLRMNSAAAVLQAAIDGQGIALMRSIMAADDLAAGRLVCLFPKITCASAWSYWLIYLAESEKQAKIWAFKRWLQAQTV